MTESSNWRDKPITDKQRACIDNMLDFSPYPLQDFKGTTRGEASDFIEKWGKLAHENAWAIEHGYG